MSDLSSAEVIGGAVVKITADLSGLRAGVNVEAKAVAQQAERTLAIRVPVTADVSQLKIEIPRAVMAAQATVKALPPIRIPLMLDVSGLAGQLAQIRAAVGGAGGAGWNGDPVRINIPNYRAPAITGAGSYAALPGTDPTIRINIPNAPWPHMLPGPERGIGRPAPGAFPYGQAYAYGGQDPTAWSWYEGADFRRGWSSPIGANDDKEANQLKKLSRFTGQATKVLALAGGIAGDVGGGYYAARAAMQDGSTLGLDQRQKFIEAGQQAISGIPLVGGIINRIGYGGYAVGSSLKNLVTGGGLRTDYAIAEDTKAEAAEQDRQTEMRRASVTARREEIIGGYDNARRIGFANSLYGATAGEAGLAQAQFGLSEFNRLHNGGGDEVIAQRAAMQTAVRIAATERNKESGIFTNDVNANVDAAGLRLGGLRAYYHGDTEAAAKAERDAQRVTLDNQQKAEAERAPASQKGGVMVANAANLKLFDEQSAKEAYDRQKQRAADLVQTIGVKQAAALTISKQYFQAELVAFDAKTKAEIGLINDVTAKQNAAARAAAERSVIVAQENQRAGEATDDHRASATESRLRADHQNDRADLEAFERYRNKELGKITNKYGTEYESRVDDLNAEHDALAQRQKEAKAAREVGYTARLQAAQAFGKGGEFQPLVAAEIGKIANLKNELAASQKGERPELAAAQIAELKADQKRLTQGGFGVEVDARRMSTMGPSTNDSGQMVSLLKIIADAISYIKANGGIPIAG